MAEALYAYEAVEADELTIAPGDAIEVLDKADGGWWTGRVGRRTGRFPGNYVRELP
ncbi:unnamed protein product, partial [Phaeothamnion confervicola]